MLGGKSGCGKTDLLKALKARGEQIIDLEKLANHKGSAFGSLGESSQSTTEQFENNLFATLQKMDLNRHIWIENENRAIGSLAIPEGVWQRMKSAPLIFGTCWLSILIK